MMRDQEFGMLRFRAFGIFSFRVGQPAILLRELFGTNSTFTTQAVSEQLRKIISSGLADTVATSQIPALDLSMHYDQLGDQCMMKLQPKFEEYGLDVTSLIIENISLPKEVEEVLDKRTSMGILGDMGKYTSYQAAEALRDAAKNTGSGAAGAGIGLGAGLTLGNIMANNLANQQAPQQPASPPMVPCPNCNTGNPAGFKFCGNCGTSMVPPKPKCQPCGKEYNAGTRFCPECGSKLV
jgi:membrane protease subunit (stomatin/prohibitin family)